MRSTHLAPDAALARRDQMVITAARQMLGMAIRSGLASSAQIISVARLLHVLERFPPVTDTGPLSVTLMAPKKRYGETETHFW